MRSALLPALAALALGAASTTTTIDTTYYKADWASLDSRPLPPWYDESKLGIFVHWGVYSVPGFHSEWFWYNWKIEKQPDVVAYMEENYAPTWTYQAFAPQLTASLFDPAHWAELFAASGAKYVVVTAKHHEGFTLYPSKYSANWNSDIGPGRDLLAELKDHVLGAKLRFGLYHSMFEWFHPLYLADKAANFSTNAFVIEKVLPELRDLVERFQPDVLWSDGDGEATSEYWRSQDFLAWLYNDSPVRESVVTNDRWGAGCPCTHGGFFSCDDRFVPGALQPHKYESCQTIDRWSWGYRREARIEDFLSLHDILRLLVSVVATNGNLLLNVAPDHLGIIHPVFEERLRGLGAWLAVNGAAIYATRPWDRTQSDPASPETVWYTTAAGGELLYAILLEWPAAADNDGEGEAAPLLLRLASPKTPRAVVPGGGGGGGGGVTVAAAARGLRHSTTEAEAEGRGPPTVSLLGYGDPLVPWLAAEDGEEGIVLDLTALARDARVPKREWAWAFVLEGFE